MASNQSNQDNNQHTGGYIGEIEASIGLDDFLNNFGAATSSAASSMSSRDWGVHNNTLNMGGASSLSIKQVLLWGGVALLGFWLIRKVRG